ncbi:hypothetical protein HWV23_13080 [Natronomonas halophila]|uniref:hypothetical protein n=1 Tax=Natronomonas halophila TaxID=2747817 RepID=UPI0015B5D271|nr:hypothetical protein [Natronomonas halophila]QLD86620.1 hypothetical protein HWV23_13080 [Natronomonas halophila]
MSDEPADRLRERSGRSTAVLYLLLDADRRLITTGIVTLVFVATAGLSLVVPDAVVVLRETDSVDTAFQALIGATVTGVTLVLTLNQLVLSQELGAVGDQRERMDGAMTFRDDIRDLLGETPSAEPSAFLQEIVEEIADRATAVDESGPLDEDLESMLGGTVRNAELVSDRLDGASFGEFEVVRAALDFNYSWKLHVTRRALDRDDLPEATRESLESLAEALRVFAPAREHFKTLYFQAELIELSRTVLYAAVPALVVALGVVFYVDVGAFTGTLLGINTGVLLVSAAAAVVISPFAVLLSYVLRIATITGRTLSIGPFILRGDGPEAGD